MPSVNAPFYVWSKPYEISPSKLVPAKFLTDGDGNPVVNPNPTSNPAYSQKYRQYYTADGQVIQNANPNNYLVVPDNYSLQSTVSFAKDVAWVDQAPGAGLVYMTSNFWGTGSQNLQRTYMNADGTMTYAGADVPMFQDATSFTLGIAAQMSGYGPLAAQIGGSIYAVPALSLTKLGITGSWNNNARNMNSISAGASFIKNQNVSPLGSATIDDGANGGLSYNTTSAAAEQLAALVYPVPSLQSASLGGDSAPADINASARSDLANSLARQLDGVTGTVQIAQGTNGSLIVTTNSGVTVNINSDLSGSKTIPTDSSGSFTQTDFDSNGGETSVVTRSVSGNTDASGNVTKVVTDTTTDRNGNLLSTTTDTQQFNTIGTLTGETMVNADGSQSVYIVNADGSSSYRLLNGAGQLMQTAQFNADGSSGGSLYDPTTGALTATASFNGLGELTESVQISSPGSSADSFYDPATGELTGIKVTGTGETLDASNTKISVATGSQATLVGTGNAFSLGAGSSLTVATQTGASSVAVVTTDSEGNTTLDFDGGSVLLGPNGQQITQSASGALSVSIGSAGPAQVAVYTGSSQESPIDFTGITSITLKLDGGYSVTDRSGNAYTFEPTSDASSYALRTASDSLPISVVPGAVSTIAFGTNIVFATTSGATLTMPASGGSATLDLGSLGNEVLDAGSAISLGTSSIDVSAPGTGTTNSYSFTTGGNLASIATYDDSSAQSNPSQIAYFSPSGEQTRTLVNNGDGTSQVVNYNASDPSGGFINQIQTYSGVDGTGSLTQQLTNFTNGLSEIDDYGTATGVVVTKTTYSGEAGNGEILSQTTNLSDGTSTVTTYASSGNNSTGLSESGLTSQTTTYSGWDGSGTAVDTTYSGANVTTIGTNIGSSLGSTIGRLLGGNSAIESIGLSSVLGTLGKDVGQIVDSSGTAAEDLSQTIDRLADSALPSVASTGAGAVGAYLTAELVKDLGITGLPAEIVDTGAGYVVSTVATNLTEEALGNTTVSWNSGLSANSFAGSFAGFAGAELASLSAHWDTPAEADLAAIGGAIGSAIGGYYGPLGAFAGGFIGDLLGGMIGSAFGGDNPWTAGTLAVAGNSMSPFSYVQTASHDDGPDAYLASLGNAAATELNAIVADAGAKVTNAPSLNRVLFLNAQGPESNLIVGDSGSAPMDFDIHDAADYVNWVVFDQLSKMMFNGGDAYVERAINTTVQQWQAAESALTGFGKDGESQYGSNPISLDTLLGNIQVAKDYEKYLQNETTINGLIAANPTSDFAAGWIIELQQAAALNLADGSTAPAFSGKYGTLDYMGVVDNYGMTAHSITDVIEFYQSNIPASWYPADFGREKQATVDGTGMVLQLQISALPLVVNGDEFQLQIAGNSNGVTVNGQTEDVTVQGDGNVVTENGDFGTASVFGNGNSVTINGQEATIVLSGSRNSLSNANGTVSVADNSNATINGLQESVSVWNHSTLVVNGGQMNVSVDGANNAVTVNGDSEKIALMGDDNSLIDNGHDDTVYITGTNESLTQGSGVVEVADGLCVTANGQNFAIKAGNYDQLTVGGQDIGVTLSGQNNGVTMNGNSMGISGSTFGSSLTNNGNGNSIVVSGNGNIIKGNGSSGYIRSTGNDSKLVSNGQSFTLEASGAGNTLTENGDNGFMAVNGNGNVVNANGRQISVNIAGGDNTVTIGNGAVSLAVGATGVINGVADSISVTSAANLTIDGGSMHVVAAGQTDNIIANGDSSVIDMQGGSDSLTANGSGVAIDACGNYYGMTLNGDRDRLSISGNDNSLWINGQQNVATLTGIGNTVHSSGLSAIVLDSSGAEFDGGGNSVTVSNQDIVTMNGSGFTVKQADTDSTTTLNGDYEVATIGGNGNSLNINGNSSSVALSGESNAVTISGLAASIAASGVQQSVTDNQGNITIADGSQINLVGNGSIVTLGDADTLTIQGSNNWVNATLNDNVTMTGTGNGIGGDASGITAVLAGDGQYAVLNHDQIDVQGAVHVSVSGDSNAISAGQGATVTLGGQLNSLQMTGGSLMLAGQPSVTGSNSQTGSGRSGFAIDGFDYTSYRPGEFSALAGQASVQALAGTGANSVSLVVTQYVNNVSDIDIERTASTETDASLEQAITNAKVAGLSVTLKPHLDVADGTWRADLAPSDVEQFFVNYQSMIVHYATIAQATGAKTLVIGTEMESLSSSAYEPYWETLIAAVRQVYSGQLTYASGWNETANVSFWGKLDVIGADAYIPVTSQADPSLQQLEEGWTTVSSDANAASAMENLSPLAFYERISGQYDKPVLFTEIGYQSVNDTNQLEGAFGTSNWVDFQQQSQALQAFFSTFTQNGGSWFQGAYLWNWEANSADVQANDFSVQGKPALDIVDYWYGRKTATSSSGGTPNTVNGDSNVITIGSGNALNINGGNNQITLSASAAVDVNGKGNTVDVTGGNNAVETVGATTINLKQNGVTLVVDGDTDTVMTNGNNDGLAVNTNNSIVTLSGAADALALTGNASTINVTGYSDTLSIVGAGNTINVSGSGAVLQTNGSNTIKLSGTGIQASVDGGGDVIDIGGIGDSISMTGTGATIVGDSGQSSLSLDGGNYQVMAKNGNYYIVAGDGTNIINVGSGSNTISLGNGNDSVVLGDGADTVTLGSGTDTIALGNGNDAVTLGGNDALTMSVAAGDSGNTATALISSGSNTSPQSNELIFSEANSDQLWFTRSNNDLLVSVIGTSSEIDIAGWFDGNSTAIQSFAAADGKLLTSSDVNSLVTAMASFSAPSAGSTALPTSYENQLQSVIAANWH